MTSGFQPSHGVLIANFTQLAGVASRYAHLSVCSSPSSPTKVDDSISLNAIFSAPRDTAIDIPDCAENGATTATFPYFFIIFVSTAIPLDSNPSSFVISMFICTFCLLFHSILPIYFSFAKIVLLFHYFLYFCGAFSEMWCLGAEFVFDYMVLPDSKFRTEDEICITT